MKKTQLLLTVLALFVIYCHQPLPPELRNRPPNAPQLVFPEDGAMRMPVALTLQWETSDPNEYDTLRCDIYLQKNNANPHLYKANLPADSLRLDSLDFDSQYFWQVIVRDQKNLQTEGPVWNFRTRVEHNNPPRIPANPMPQNHQQNVAIDDVNFSWEGGDPDSFSVVAYDVSWGVQADSLRPLRANLSDTSFALSLLPFDTKFYWQVTARDEYESVQLGPVWDFTTEKGSLVFWEPFDTYSQNEKPPVPPWTIADSASSIYITNETSYNEQGNSLCFMDSTVQGYSFIAAHFASMDLGMISFYWKVSNATDYFGLRLYSNEADTAHLGPQISIREGKMEFFSHNRSWENITNVAAGRWYFVEVVFSCEKKIFQVFVNNELKAESATWIGSTVPSIDSIYFMTFKNRVCERGYVDEIKVIKQ
ncbi:MAG: hypothetical protein GXO74_08525 [Calditrichaeota bacterium]|nr:hypothetical protein [Calditrichota bacterium]